MKHQKLKELLLGLQARYDSPSFLNSDPIQIPHQFQSPEDIEISSFISALFSYGNVKAILTYLNHLFSLLEQSPSKFLSHPNSIHKIRKFLRPYRFQSSEDVFHFLLVLSQIWSKHKSLEIFFNGQFFSSSYPQTQDSTSPQFLQKNFIYWQYFFLEHLPNFRYPQTRGLRFLIGSGSLASPNKRLYMFLRWMVRKKFPDFGVYTTISPQNLVFPLDVHIFRLSLILGLRTSKTLNWKTAREITDEILFIEPEDPLQFDFSLSRLGILKECRSQYISSICDTCKLHSVCSVYNSSLH
jgi:uncharacterized protein (TIGR02757 family)